MEEEYIACHTSAHPQPYNCHYISFPYNANLCIYHRNHKIIHNFSQQSHLNLTCPGHFEITEYVQCRPNSLPARPPIPRQTPRPFLTLALASPSNLTSPQHHHQPSFLPHTHALCAHRRTSPPTLPQQWRRRPLPRLSARPPPLDVAGPCATPRTRARSAYSSTTHSAPRGCGIRATAHREVGGERRRARVSPYRLLR